MATKLPIRWTILAGIVAVSFIPALEAQTVSQPLLPKGCAESDIAKYGPPFMFPRREGIAYGVSIEKTRFKADERIRVHIWLSNESAKELRTTWCCQSTFLLYFRVLDALGESLPSKTDPDAIGGPGWGCGCSSGSGILSPHLHGFCGVIDRGTLNEPETAYTLSPGKYIIVEHRRSSQAAEPLSSQSGATGLTITVEPLVGEKSPLH